jgi:hypothetical protein
MMHPDPKPGELSGGPLAEGLSSYKLHARTKQEQIERCKREIEACRRAGGDPSLTPAQKLGAIQGEVDWIIALEIAEEER